MDIPTATTSAAAPATSSPTPALTAVQVALADITQALENLTHSVQINAVPANPPLTVTPQGTQLTLETSGDTITVNLPQLTAAEQQALLQALQTLAQTQRPLTLAIQPGAPPTQATLLIPTLPVATQSQTAPAPPPVPPPLPPPPIAVGETLPAIVLPNIPATIAAAPPPAMIAQGLPIEAAPPPALPPLTPQTPAPAIAPAITDDDTAAIPPTIAANEIPVAAPAPGPISAPPLNVPSEAIPELPAALPSAAAPPVPVPAAALLQPGNQVAVTVDAILPAGQIPPPLAPNQIVATVTGIAPGGQIILKAGEATLFIRTPVMAAPGLQMVLTIGAAPSPLMTLPADNPSGLNALPQIVAALAQADPQALQQMLAARMPQPNAALPGTLMLLFGAFKQADARGWLGDDATGALLRMGKADLIASLSRDLGSGGHIVQDPVVGEWRAFPIPLYAQQAFQALTLYVHDGSKDRQGNPRGTAGNANKIRFVIDMRLSRLGEMQIDGFVQPKKLDMVLRSAALLPEGLHHHLRGAYIKAMGAVGYTGALNFQVGRAHWMVMNKSRSQAIV